MVQRKYIIFITASLALMMMSVNTNIVATALPAIKSDLGAELNWTAWIITAYQLTTLTLMPLMGCISDEWGRKRIFLACVAIFTVSSFLCSLAPNIYWLIFFRFLQAMGGSGFMPSATGIVSDYFQENRPQAIGLFTSIFPIGGVAGPALGGFLLDVASWEYIFWVNVPLGVLVFVLTYFLLEKDRCLVRTKIDYGGAALFAATIISLMYFITQLSDDTGRPLHWANYLLPPLAVAFLLAFIRREKRITHPIIDIALLHSRPFAIMNILNLLYGACTFGVSSFIPYYGQVVYGLSDLTSGTLLTARALGMMGTATIVSMGLRRTGYRFPMAVGFLALALSTVGLNPYFQPLIIAGYNIPSFWWMATLIFVTGVGMGLISPSSNNATIELMPDKISAISGLRGMLRQTGGVMGTSVIVYILSLYPDKAKGFSVVFLGMGLLLLMVTPLIMWVPEKDRNLSTKSMTE